MTRPAACMPQVTLGAFVDERGNPDWDSVAFRLMLIRMVLVIIAQSGKQQLDAVLLPLLRLPLDRWLLWWRRLLLRRPLRHTGTVSSPRLPPLHAQAAPLPHLLPSHGPRPGPRPLPHHLLRREYDLVAAARLARRAPCSAAGEQPLFTRSQPPTGSSAPSSCSSSSSASTPSSCRPTPSSSSGRRATPASPLRARGSSFARRPTRCSARARPWSGRPRLRRRMRRRAAGASPSPRAAAASSSRRAERMRRAGLRMTCEGVRYETWRGITVNTGLSAVGFWKKGLAGGPKHSTGGGGGGAGRLWEVLPGGLALRGGPQRRAAARRRRRQRAAPA